MRYFLSGLLLVSCLALPTTATAVSSNVFNAGGGIGGQIEAETGLGNTNPVAASDVAINIALGFLGIILVALFLYGGFLWMTAGGNEENIAKAKKMLSAAVVGMILIALSAGLANYILTQIGEASGASINTGASSSTSTTTTTTQ